MQKNSTHFWASYIILFTKSYIAITEYYKKSEVSIRYNTCFQIVNTHFSINKTPVIKIIYHILWLKKLRWNSRISNQCLLTET